MVGMGIIVACVAYVATRRKEDRRADIERKRKPSPPLVERPLMSGEDPSSSNRPSGDDVEAAAVPVETPRKKKQSEEEEESAFSDDKRSSPSPPAAIKVKEDAKKKAAVAAAADPKIEATGTDTEALAKVFEDQVIQDAYGDEHEETGGLPSPSKMAGLGMVESPTLKDRHGGGSSSEAPPPLVVDAVEAPAPSSLQPDKPRLSDEASESNLVVEDKDEMDEGMGPRRGSFSVEADRAIGEVGTATASANDHPQSASSDRPTSATTTASSGPSTPPRATRTPSPLPTMPEEGDVTGMTGVEGVAAIAAMADRPSSAKVERDDGMGPGGRPGGATRPSSALGGAVGGGGGRASAPSAGPFGARPSSAQLGAGTSVSVDFGRPSSAGGKAAAGGRSPSIPANPKEGWRTPPGSPGQSPEVTADQKKRLDRTGSWFGGDEEKKSAPPGLPKSKTLNTRRKK